MPTFSETFLCTALPERISGSKVRVAVLVSPRLISDTPANAGLDNWPDVRDWPGIDPTWQLTISQGGTTVTLPATEVPAEPYDEASWSALFPPDMPVTPYQPKDRSQAPIVSYPVSKVRDAVKELHLAVLTDSCDEFPTVTQLDRMPRFQDLKRAADPDSDPTADGSPKPDADIGVAEAFARTDMFHGVRPGSQRPVPRVQRLTPRKGHPDGGTEVRIEGTDFIAPLTVHFDQTPARNVRPLSPGTILCQSPPRATPTDNQMQVTVTTRFGTSATNEDTIFYYDTGIG